MSDYPYERPHPSALRTGNISQRPNLQGTIYVETAMPPPTSIPERQGGDGSSSTQLSQQQQQQNLNDVAGVLRRNQACLNCRRRKLKCDAVRPHCGTCVRSYKHLLRTAPKTNPQLACEYDDANTSGHDHGDSASVDDGDDEMEGTKKKRKKALGDGKRKKKDDEDDETERLRKKIEALEAQLANKGDSQDGDPSPQSTWPPQQSAFGASSISAPSPTAFLEMLSSAASAQVSSTSAETNNIPGLRSGASENAMMSTTWATTPKDSGTMSSGLTPYLSYMEDQTAQPSQPSRPPIHEKNSANDSDIASGSRRSSAQGTNPSPYGVNSSNSPAGPSILSPNGIFNFSPAPSGPTAGSGPPASISENLNWPPSYGPNGLQPSTRTEGPWRAVETVTNVFPLPNQNSNINAENNPLPQAQSQQIDVDMSGAAGNLFGGDEALQQQLLMDLFWPGWPPNLPEPNIVNDLVGAFFDLVPNMPRLLHRPRFLARLALPPTHSNFPHPALIHAVCAAAASWCEPSVYERSAKAKWPEYLWNSGGNAVPQEKTMSFALKQAAYGKEAVQDGLNTGNRLFDVVRAMIILSRVFIDDTRMLECWAYAGLVARMLLPLGLNVRSAELSLKSVMLPPPADALEREERRVAVWMAFYHDTIASAASGWGTSMSLEELSVPLPVSAKVFESGDENMEGNPQDLDSPDFWTKHPVPDPFCLVVKASVLMNRVNRFVRRWKNRHLREDDDLDGMQRPEFRELANAVACFQMSFPANLRNPAKLNHKKCLDIDLIAAHMLPHAAVICLYEAFADISDPNDAPARRILGAAQNIVTIIQQLATVANSEASNLSNVMHSSASVCLVTSARTILLFYRLALNQQDYAQAESHRMDIEMIRMSLQSWGYRFKIGHHHSQLIEYFLDRATNPTYEKLVSHYPTHPRPGAPDLHPQSDFGVCILNALNIKRGYWKQVASSPNSAGISPFTSTPESATYASSNAQGQSSSSHGTGGSASATERHGHISRRNTDSPNSYPGNPLGTLGPEISSGYGGQDNNMAFGSIQGKGFSDKAGMAFGSILSTGFPRSQDNGSSSTSPNNNNNGAGSNQNQNRPSNSGQSSNPQLDPTNPTFGFGHMGPFRSSPTGISGNSGNNGNGGNSGGLGTDNGGIPDSTIRQLGSSSRQSGSQSSTSENNAIDIQQQQMRASDEVRQRKQRQLDAMGFKGAPAGLRKDMEELFDSGGRLDASGQRRIFSMMQPGGAMK